MSDDDALHQLLGLSIKDFHGVVDDDDDDEPFAMRPPSEHAPAASNAASPPNAAAAAPPPQPPPAAATTFAPCPSLVRDPDERASTVLAWAGARARTELRFARSADCQGVGGFAPRARALRRGDVLLQASCHDVFHNKADPFTHNEE